MRIPSRLKGAVMAMAACASLAMMAPTPAFAVHDLNLFELDGNAVAEDIPGDDWSSIVEPDFPGTTTGVVPDPGRASGGNNVSDISTFTGGGSKDVNDISEWRYTSGSIPDKDDITNAYAVAERVDHDQNPDTPPQLVVYFGADRFSNNGDSSIGFWFFQQDVQLRNGRFMVGNSTTPATHRNGDLLVLADFTQGGAIGTVKVYEWVNGALNTTPVSGVDCSTASAGDNVCAIINASGSASSPWPYSPKSGTAGQFPTGSFFEGGINVSAIFAALNQSVPCFSSFLAETRSSQSPTAQLKDFVLAGFPVCGISVGKACDTTRPPVVNSSGDSIHTVFNVPIRNTGVGTVFNVTLAEDATSFTAGTPTDSCKITAIDTTRDLDIALGTTPVEVKASLGGGLTTNVVVECDTDDNPMVNKVNAAAKSSSGLTASDLTASHTTSPAETCTAQPIPDMTVTKTCNPGTAQLVGDGTFTFKICNDFTITSTTTEKLINISVVDDKSGTVFNNVTLNPGATQTVNKCYTASAPNIGLDGGNTTVSNLKFKDQITSLSFTGDVSNTTVTRTTGLPSAQCPLCPTCTQTQQ